MFVQVRKQAFDSLSRTLNDLGLGPLMIRSISWRLTPSRAPTVCSSKEIAGDNYGSIGLFKLHGQTLYNTAQRMIEENEQQ